MPKTDCGNHNLQSRRRFMFGSLGTASAALLSTPNDAPAASLNAKPRTTAKTCIFINLAGAPSHIDLFDPKDGPCNPPDADIRQYGDILLSNRYFPMLSTMTSDMCVLRSVSSWEAAHTRGQFYLQTAHIFNPNFARYL